MTLRNPPEHTDPHPQGGFGAPIRPEPKTPTPPPLRQPQPGAIPVDIADLGMILRDTEKQAAKCKQQKAGVTMVRNVHPYGFRTGKWAEFLGVESFTPEGREPRDCYKVRFDDGVEDLWPIGDDVYEWITPQPHDESWVVTGDAVYNITTTAWPAYSADYQAGYRDGYAAAQKAAQPFQPARQWSIAAVPTPIRLRDLGALTDDGTLD